MLVCMDKLDQYLSIDTKPRKSREGIATTLPAMVRRVTKNNLVRRGFNMFDNDGCDLKYTGKEGAGRCAGVSK